MEEWTCARLTTALAGALGDDVTIRHEDGVVELTFNDAGGISVMMTVEGDQMLASTLLWPRSEQENAAAFEEQALRMHKYLPLSTIALTRIGDHDWYELFGALSTTSTLDNVVLELNMLVQNALDLADARARDAA